LLDRWLWNSTGMFTEVRRCAWFVFVHPSWKTSARGWYLCRETLLGFLGNCWGNGRKTCHTPSVTPYGVRGAVNFHLSREASEISRYLFWEAKNPFSKVVQFSRNLPRFSPIMALISEMVSFWCPLSRKANQDRLPLFRGHLLLGIIIGRPLLHQRPWNVMDTFTEVRSYVRFVSSTAPKNLCRWGLPLLKAPSLEFGPHSKDLCMTDLLSYSQYGFFCTWTRQSGNAWCYFLQSTYVQCFKF